MYMSIRKLSGVLIVFTVLNGSLWWAATGQSAAVKPVGQALSDEQLGVLAVRSVKPAVVSVIGSAPLPNHQARQDTIFGSGFIVSPDGYIVTNSHVVSSTNAEFRVVLLDGKHLPARIVGVDTYSDIALLKVDGVNMAVVRFGNSDALETGQTVFAIGDALGKYQRTVTRGVVSGLDRDVTLDSSRPRYKNLIETDATINQGNSGGPLVNMSGEVVGMTTLLEQGTGLGFAIPANYIRATFEQLKSLGKATRPYLGVSYTRVDQAVKAVAGLSVDAGAYVQSVTGGSPAANAGIREGDVITRINGEAIGLTQELDKLLTRFTSGAQILLHIDRAGQQLDVPVILGEYK